MGLLHTALFILFRDNIKVKCIVSSFCEAKFPSINWLNKYLKALNEKQIYAHDGAMSIPDCGAAEQKAVKIK